MNLAALVLLESTLCLLAADWLWRITPWPARRIGLGAAAVWLGLLGVTLAVWH